MKTRRCPLEIEKEEEGRRQMKEKETVMPLYIYSVMEDGLWGLASPFSTGLMADL